ncbi:MAG: hypothetical protein ACR2O3_14200 [Rhizobiaceae bacterium]
MVDNIQSYRGRQHEFRTLAGMLALVIAGYLLFVWPQTENYEISDSRCNDLNSLWKEAYSKEFRFSDNWPSGKFKCLSPTSGMAQALHFLATTNFVQPEGQKFDFYQWVRKLNPVFEKGLMLNSAGLSDITEKRIALSTIILEKNNPVEIANVIIHEVRHLEEGFNSHVPCTRDWALTCDQRLNDDPFEGGAYNFNMVFLHHVRQFSDADDTSKRRARKLMQPIFEKRFNLISPKDREKYGLD